MPLGAIDWRTIYPEAAEIVRRDILTNFFSQGFRVLAEVSRDSIVKDLEGYLRRYITKPIDRGSVLNGLRKYFPAVERIGIDESNCLSYEHLLLFPLPKPKENKQFPLLFNFAGLSYLGVDSDTVRRLESYRISFLNQPDEQTADLIQPFSELLRESGTKNLENLTLNQIESFVNYCTLGMRVEGAGNSQKEVWLSRQDVTNVLDSLGIFEKVEANREHIQETVNQLITTTFKGMLLPDKADSLSIVEHTPQQIAEHQKLDRATSHMFHYILNLHPNSQVE